MSKLLSPFRAVGRHVGQTVAELSKVVTPTGRELAGWALAAGVFVALLMAFASLSDTGFGWIAMTVFA